VSPSRFLPSEATQSARRAALSGVDLERAAQALTASLVENELSPAPFRPAVERIRRWRDDTLTLAEVRRRLPPGLLDNVIAEIGPGRYLVAVTAYSANPVATAAVPAATVAALEREAGPLVEFSYDRIGRDLHRLLVVDSRFALAGTLVGVVTIVLVGFRHLTPTLIVLAPIAYGVVVAFGLLALAGHSFSAMAFSSVPLIIGIGIDNGIHLVRRYLEREDRDVHAVVAASGPAVIQTNLTTIVGFGALTSSSFRPLAEMGLITALGVGCTLVASLSLLPALLSATSGRRGASR
jgi:predicted exporter